jgi:hypothetical protein
VALPPPKRNGFFPASPFPGLWSPWQVVHIISSTALSFHCMLLRSTNGNPRRKVSIRDTASRATKSTACLVLRRPLLANTTSQPSREVVKSLETSKTAATDYLSSSTSPILRRNLIRRPAGSGPPSSHLTPFHCQIRICCQAKGVLQALDSPTTAMRCRCEAYHEVHVAL